MRKSMIWVLPLMLLTAAVAGELKIGSEMPLAEVKMTDVGGKNVSLKDAMGENGLLVVFSCKSLPSSCCSLPKKPGSFMYLRFYLESGLVVR